MEKLFIISIVAMIIIMPLSGAVGVKKSTTSETFIGFLTNDNGYTNITAQEAFEEYLSCYCAFYQIPIDVRTESEWNDEHIETYGDEQKPVNWPDLQEGVGLSEFLNEYAYKEVIIYCRSGVRSWKATQLLIDNGFTGTIYNMVGGILAWKAAEYPTAISVHNAYAMLMSTSDGIQTPIDIRTVEEWKKGRIKTPAPQNPVNYPDLHLGVGLNEFMTNYEGKEVIIYCKTGIRSDQALDLLILKMFEGEFNGYVHNMIGGIDAWIDAGYPTPTPIKSQFNQTVHSNLMNFIQNKPNVLLLIRQLLNHLTSSFIKHSFFL